MCLLLHDDLETLGSKSCRPAGRVQLRSAQGCPVGGDQGRGRDDQHPHEGRLLCLKPSPARSFLQAMISVPVAVIASAECSPTYHEQ
eukprot:5923760-Amphidinium_carterae.1